jgi:hypothetical protein
VTAKNDGHAAYPVSKLIEDRCIEYYSVDITSMAKWVMSDTVASTRSVANHFEDSDQEDCSMHILNLCIGYGIGMKENVRTTKTTDPTTGATTSVKSFVTDGGALPQGADVIRKLRALNNYFCTPKRREKLALIQDAHSLPVLAPLLDIDVRVGSACQLMRRSIVNYTAMKLFFLEERRANPFKDLKEADWSLIREMEGATLFLAQLALVQTQSESLVASYMLVFRAVAEANLKSRSFDCLSLGVPAVDFTDKKSLQREPMVLGNFSAPGRVCVARCLAQVRNRFPALSTGEVIALLLDPRTKNCALEIIDGMGVPTAHRESLLAKASEQIVQELVSLYECKQRAPASHEHRDSVGSSPETKAYSALPSASTVSTSFTFASPVPHKTKRGYQET